MKVVGIVDYEVGNLSSLRAAVAKTKHKVVAVSAADEIKSVDFLILPGVGAFFTAMHELQKRGLYDAIKQYANAGNPLLGICLGMQLLAGSSDEIEYCEGLDLIPGEIKQIPCCDHHIGWSQLDVISAESAIPLNKEDSFYFNHSYFFEGDDQYASAHVNCKRQIPAIIKKDNVMGVQFHPEKSQKSGVSLLANIIERLA